VTGQLWSQATLELRAGGDIAVLSQASAGALGNVSVTAQGITLNSGAVLGAGLDGQGKFTGNGTLNLYAANVTNAGTLKATQDIDFALSGTLNNQPETATTTTTISWLGLFSGQAGTTSVQPGGQIEAGRNLSVTAAQVTNGAGATIQVGGKAAITAGSLENYGSVDSNGPRGAISGQMLVINAGDIANAGKLLASQDLSINSSGQASWRWPFISIQGR
jgi:filamentous hemagglutinin